MTDAGITLLGLGPGDPALLTRQAWELLSSISEIYLRTSQHPIVAGFPPTLRVHSFDHLYEQNESFEDVYDQIIEHVLDLGKRPQGIVYAVPGHPFVAEATSPEIFRRAKDLGIPVRVVEGLSFLEPVFSALGIDPLPNLVIADALELAIAHVPSFPPDFPALIAQIHSPAVASEVKLTLMAVYPDEHPVRLVHGAGTKRLKVEDLKLYEIDRSREIGLMTSLYVPPLGSGTSFEALQEVTAHLRAPEGCPWDREQTHQSLRPYLLEEAYEVLAALDAEDPVALREELGDLLFQIFIHAQVASEYGEFNLPEVVQTIHTKLVHRHPHVFGDLDLKDTRGILENWERLKAAERETKGKQAESLLDGVPQGLPALLQAQTYQERAAHVGFDWENIAGVFDKVREELEEVSQANGPDEQASEAGDLLFSVVNLARWFKVDAESALRAANARFRERFFAIEKAARIEGKDLSKMSLAEMDELWNQAKHR